MGTQLAFAPITRWVIRGIFVPFGLSSFCAIELCLWCLDCRSIDLMNSSLVFRHFSLLREDKFLTSIVLCYDRGLLREWGPLSLPFGFIGCQVALWDVMHRLEVLLHERLDTLDIIICFLVAGGQTSSVSLLQLGLVIITGVEMCFLNWAKWIGFLYFFRVGGA